MIYGYAILYSIIESDIHISNLSVSLPFVHGISRTAGGLQYDLADIFKPVIVDRLIFRLINKKQITIECFDVFEDKVYLNKHGIKIFLEEFDNILNSTVSVSSKHKISYRSILKKEVFKLEKSILNKSKYKGYLMRW